MGIVISTLGGIILLGERNKAAADRYRHRHHTDRRSRRLLGIAKLKDGF
ncbi:hypothetical protein PO124_12890 [Bacillus licheniformis]|nr:hypothetical protein [Bacillus licheniformis]